MTTETKTAHTPGPWVIFYFPSKDTEDGNAKTAIQCYADENGDEGATLATVNRWSYYDDPPTAESEANASLIAAAPDLLEACRLAKIITNRYGDEDPDASSIGRDCYVLGGFIDEAIEKTEPKK